MVRVKHILGLASFAYLSSFVVVLASERVYWLAERLDLEALFVTPLFYALPMTATLWLLARYEVALPAGVVIAGTVFAFGVEGVLTNVLYEDGPVPILALMLAGWHGVVSFTGFWYLCHRWLVDRRRMRLSIWSAVFGLYFGLWFYVSTLAATIDEATIILPPLQVDGFALYALTITACLAVAHWLLALVWPTDLKASNASGIIIGLLLAGYMALAVLPAVPWAPLKLVSLVLLALFVVKRSKGVPTVFASLSGEVRPVDTLALSAMPMAATAAYWLASSTDMTAPDAVGYTEALVWSHLLIGVVGVGWASMRLLRRRDDAGVDVGNVTPQRADSP